MPIVLATMCLYPVQSQQLVINQLLAQPSHCNSVSVGLLQSLLIINFYKKKNNVIFLMTEKNTLSIHHAATCYFN